MSIAISNSLSTASVAAENGSLSAAAARSPQPITKASGDTVRLSEAQQVYQLYNQGQRVSQIASSLNLSQTVVNHYLGITNGAG